MKHLIKYNMLLFAVSVLVMMFIFSCCTTKPAVITKTECNQKAIDNYVRECVPNAAQGTEWKFYYDECKKQAQKKFPCNEKRYIVVKGQTLPCDSVPEKYMDLCK